MSILFFDLLYKITVWIHIASGFLATFIVIPINLLNKKGSKFHKIIGKISIYLVLSIVISGLLMLINPIFNDKFALSINKHHWNSFFKAAYYGPLFFIWLDIISIYMVGSSIRVWSRVNAIRRGLKSYNFLDIFLATIMALSSIFFIYVGIYDYKNHITFAYAFILLGSLLLIISIGNLFTFRKSANKILLNWGWLAHGFKMLFFWHGLITAFLIRENVENSVETLHPFTSFGLRILTMFVFVIYWLNHNKKTTRLN